MRTIAAEPGSRGEAGRQRRIPATLAALAAGMAGYALADAMSRARTTDAFLVAPTPAQLGGYLLAAVALAAVALVLEIGGPMIAVRGILATRQVRAALRRRLRHGRTRAEIANAEVGLTVSLCAILLAAALVSASTKSILVVAIVAGIYVTARALLSLCRVTGFDPAWSGLFGFLYGLFAGSLLT